VTVQPGFIGTLAMQMDTDFSGRFQKIRKNLTASVKFRVLLMSAERSRRICEFNGWLRLTLSIRFWP
jgi:hypothetical protein